MKKGFFVAAIGGALLTIIIGLAAEPADPRRVGQNELRGQIVITADTMVLESKNIPNVITFEGNVVANDPQFVLRCAKLVAAFDQQTRKILRVDATGGVTITQTNRVGKAEKATYTPDDGKIVLEGGAPRLEAPEGNVEGKVITYFRDSEKVIITGARMEIKPDELKQPNP